MACLNDALDVINGQQTKDDHYLGATFSTAVMPCGRVINTLVVSGELYSDAGEVFVEDNEAEGYVLSNNEEVVDWLNYWRGDVAGRNEHLYPYATEWDPEECRFIITFRIQTLFNLSAC
jgi:hypothetical protein